MNAYVFAPIGSRWLDALIVLIAAETMDLYTPFKAPNRGGQAVRFADATNARGPILVPKTFVNAVNCGI